MICVKGTTSLKNDMYNHSREEEDAIHWSSGATLACTTLSVLSGLT